MRTEKADLLVKLRQCRVKISEAELKLADLPKAIDEQKAKLKASAKHLAGLTKALKTVPGSDAEDAKAIEEVDSIRQRAISAIQSFLG